MKEKALKTSLTRNKFIKGTYGQKHVLGGRKMSRPSQSHFLIDLLLESGDHPIFENHSPNSRIDERCCAPKVFLRV